MRLNEDQCRARFADARVARLATIAQDGSPRLIPITFALVTRVGAADVIFSPVDHKPKSTTALARLRRIANEPRVSLLADSYVEDWEQLWWVRADADAAVMLGGREREGAVARLQEKYEQYQLNPPSHAVVRMVVRRWSGWTAGTAATT